MYINCNLCQEDEGQQLKGFSRELIEREDVESQLRFLPVFMNESRRAPGPLTSFRRSDLAATFQNN
jgi:hypothetical protein